MVAILSLLTLAILLLAEIRRSAKEERVGSRSAPSEAPSRRRGGMAERLYHPGHIWVVIHRPRLASVGIDDFAARFIGRVDSVEIRQKGAKVQQGKPLLTLRRGERSLTLAAPLSGIIMDINSRLSSQPSLLSESPYERGWVARLSPTSLALDMRNLVTGPIARRWRESAQEKLSHWFAPGVGVVLQDGGELSGGAGELLSDEDWEMLVKILFPLHESTEPFNSINGHGVKS